MRLFRRKKIVKFDEKEVEVYEIDVKTILMFEKGEIDNKNILLNCTNLKEEEIENLSYQAEVKLIEEFYELNKEYFEVKEGEDKGK